MNIDALKILSSNVVSFRIRGSGFIVQVVQREETAKQIAIDAYKAILSFSKPYEMMEARIVTLHNPSSLLSWF